MLTIVVPGNEFWNDKTEQFEYTDDTTLMLEHSLIAISKWEAKWHKPFIGKTKQDTKTDEETLDYIKCMTLNKNVDPKVYLALTDENIDDIQRYIRDPMTATKINDGKGKSSKQFITSELIYYWMIAYNIPKECEKWHIERLLTLIRICNVESNKHNKKNNKVNERTTLDKMAALNEKRRAELNSRG